MWISEKEGNTSTGCSTYPYIPDEAQMKNHHASYFVSIRLIFVFILDKVRSETSKHYWQVTYGMYIMLYAYYFLFVYLIIFFNNFVWV